MNNDKIMQVHLLLLNKRKLLKIHIKKDK